MVSSRLLFFLSAIFFLTAQAVAQTDFLYHFCIDNNGNYTTNSTYKRNLKHLLFSLYSNTEIDYGFYNSSYGENSDQVSVIGLCRGDVAPEDCLVCLGMSATLLPLRCPIQKEAIGWFDNCMLRYSDRSMLGVEETSPSFYMWNTNNVSANYDQFKYDLRKLLESLRSEAVAGGSLRKFAAGNATAPNNQTLYALVQCTPDLSELECNNCLLGTFQGIPTCCDGKQGGRIISPSCSMRFEVDQFDVGQYYTLTFPSSPVAPPVSPPSPLTNTNTTKGTVPMPLCYCYKMQLFTLEQLGYLIHSLESE
jgi:hypothetical protein